MTQLQLYYQLTRLCNANGLQDSAKILCGDAGSCLLLTVNDGNGVQRFTLFATEVSHDLPAERPAERRAYSPSDFLG